MTKLSSGLLEGDWFDPEFRQHINEVAMERLVIKPFDEKRYRVHSRQDRADTRAG